MNLLKMALLWALAAVIAAWAYLRLRRGKVTLLEGRLSPALVRMVSVVLVYFNAGCPEPRLPSAATGSPQSAAAPSSLALSMPSTAPNLFSKLQAAPKEFPARFEVAKFFGLQRNTLWSTTTMKLETLERENIEARQRDALDYVSYLDDQGLKDALTQKIMGRVQGRPYTLEELSALLDAIEAGSLYHAWLTGYLWRSLRPIAGEDSAPRHSQDGALATILGRLEYQQRVVHSLLLAEGAVGAVTFVPWRSKAAPPSGYSSLSIPFGLVEDATKRFPTTDAGTWESEAALVFSVKSAPPEGRFLAGGEQRGIGGTLRVSRFSMVVVPGSARDNVVLTHPSLGELIIAPGQALTAWNVKSFLSAKVVAELEATIQKGLKGETAPLSELEDLLPAVQALLREALKKDPSAKGAPALRTLLSLFDE